MCNSVMSSGMVGVMSREVTAGLILGHGCHTTSGWRRASIQTIL